MIPRNNPVERERNRLQLRIERATELPMLVLAVAWIVLTAVELVAGLSGLLLRISLIDQDMPFVRVDAEGTVASGHCTYATELPQ